ncbi:gamma-glutamyltransferase family protein [Sphingomonas sp. BN140010]|uniref:Gamma-glutamyltransferase family protein n=1 Tax=Sphingomonas arvum TaxID=2992113 RepID=A0ABT3JFT6_9SPHN|nr:gamma-glutamyltransferase family protein [Sphingomonas sp. BN140010]MCW3797866.1 gamma-glutamyltransferase family protein [Sphingomonas sp. BN140010]
MRLTYLPLTFTLLLGGCATVPASVPRAPAQVTVTQPGFVIAANPLAAEAGMAVLRRGGTAADAAVAVQAMLGLVEPQSSGLGGGAFLHYYDGTTRKLTLYDGREVAPAQATATMFLGLDGKPLEYQRAIQSGRSTGVPGAVRMLELVQREHGALPWNSLFGDAERTAAAGFRVSPRLARLIAAYAPQMPSGDVQRYFAKAGGGYLGPGDFLRNPAYAAFVGKLAAQGSRALLEGETAARIVERTRKDALPGHLTMADLAAYRPIKRESLCAPWRTYVVCTPPPPASGVGLLELLKLTERTDIAARGPNDPQAWYLFAEASRIMYADRDRYVGDPAFADVPVAGLLAPDYIARRAQLIGATAGPPPVPGVPAGSVTPAPDRTREPAGTSHFIVGDANGNVVSITTTVESIFGSGRMVDGFFLNNQLTDFSFSPVDPQGRPAANAVAPGKRPRSSMVPTILLTPDGRFAGAIGSAGGNAILAYVAKSLIAAVDWNLPMQQALAQPNLVARGAAFQGEVTKFAPSVLAGLRARGIDLQPGQGEDSGVHGVLIRNGRVDGGFDPRREGVVLVDPSGARPRR